MASVCSSLGPGMWNRESRCTHLSPTVLMVDSLYLYRSAALSLLLSKRVILESLWKFFKDIVAWKSSCSVPLLLNVSVNGWVSTVLRGIISCFFHLVVWLCDALKPLFYFLPYVLPPHGSYAYFIRFLPVSKCFANEGHSCSFLQFLLELLVFPLVLS